MGKRLPNRSVIFFVIITILAILSFNVIRAIFGPLQTAPQTTNTQIKQNDKNSDSTQVQPKINETNK